MTLETRLLRLENQIGGGDSFASVFVDRAPRETRAQWLQRKSAEHGGAFYLDPGTLNAQDETRTQWTARKLREFGR